MRPLLDGSYLALLRVAPQRMQANKPLTVALYTRFRDFDPMSFHEFAHFGTISPGTFVPKIEALDLGLSLTP